MKSERKNENFKPPFFSTFPLSLKYCEATNCYPCDVVKAVKEQEKMIKKE